MTPHPSTLALTFLDPAAGIIAGSLALPALLLLYFLKLRRRPVRISSTLLWERAVEDLQVNTPFQWLRPSLLLLLQFLALALLAAALGRPAILDPEAPPTGRIVILIDRSASMSAKDGDAQGGTRLDAARAAANELIERLSPGESEAMVVSFASEARIETPYTSSRAALRDAVAGVRATDQPGDLDGALALARAFLAPQGEESSGAPATVVLLSDGDFVRAAPDGRADLPGASFVLQRVGPAPEAARDNVGVAAISARRDESDPELVRLFVRLQSTSVEPIETALTALIDGSPVRSERVRIASASGGEPAEAPVTVTLPAPAGGMLTVSLARPDALEADNGAAVFVPPPAAIRLWLVAPGAPSPALRDALSLFVSAPEALRVMTLDEYERAAAGAAAPPDVVVFDRVRPTSLPSAPTLSFGATLPIPGLGVADAPDAPPTRFLAWRRTHPLLRDVVLDTVIVHRPLALTLPEGQPSVVATALAEGESGPLIALLEQGSVRRVVVAFELSASTWPLSYSFPIFIANAIERLGGSAGTGGSRSFLTTDPITLRAAPDARTVGVRGPIELEVIVRAEDRAAPIGALPVAGVYAATGVVGADAALAVNLANPHESRIGTADEVEIGGAGMGAGAAAGAGAREVWFWFVLAAAALLTVEWFLFAWQMRV